MINGKMQEASMLIVEDNEDMLFFLSEHFSSLYKVYTAVSGEEGWQLLYSVLPDIVISDVMLPGITGIDLCQMAKTDARTSHIPLVLLTARGADDARITGFQRGADEYIAKPFNVELLQVRVENLLHSRQLLQQHFQKAMAGLPEVQAMNAPDEMFLEQVIRFIEENIMEPVLNVECLSQEVNMSRITLYRKLKALTGLTAIEFIRNIRLKKAAQLLKSRAFNVNEACYMTGFSDVDYFRRCFKTAFGTSPKEYAELH